MVKLTKREDNVLEELTNSEDLKVGEMMEITDSRCNFYKCNFCGQIVLRAEDVLISLTNPRNTWDVNVPGLSFNGRKLLPDEVVELRNDLE